MKNCKDLKEALCETDEKNEKCFSEKELNNILHKISLRILETFYFTTDVEIAFQLKTKIDNIRAFTERGEFPSTEVLLAIHKVTGISIDWLLTGNGTKYSNPIKLPLASSNANFNNIVSAQTF